MDNPNSVLLSRLPFRSFTTASGQTGGCIDGSALPFAVEELLVCAAGEISVVRQTPIAMFVDTLAPELRACVRVIDAAPSYRKSRTFLEPVAAEFNLNIMGPGSEVACAIPETSARDTIYAVVDTVFSLDTLVLAIDNRLQIDLDIASFRRGVAHLRQILQNSQGRARLAFLDALLRTYSDTHTDCLVFNSRDPAAVVEAFVRSLEDVHYAHLSETTHDLGFPVTVHRKSVK